MAGPGPFLLTVYDRHATRLLRLRECATEAEMEDAALEEREMYVRHPHVEVECHWGRTREEVATAFAARQPADRLEPPPAA